MRDRLIPVLLGALLLHVGSARAQVSEGGVPPSFDPGVEARLVAPVPVVTLPSVDVARYRAEDEKNAHRKDIPWRYGASNPVDLGLEDAGRWDRLPNGDWLWRLEVASPGAVSLNFVFGTYDLPPGARLFLYGADRAEVLGAFTEANNQPAGRFATTLLASDRVVLEYAEPADVTWRGRLRLESVTHGYRGPKEFGEKDLGDSGGCNNNVHCPEAIGWEDPVRSVVMLVTQGNAFCSGALVNNSASDGTPYVLTANHCYSDPSTWVFWFNWESPTCSNPSTSPPHDALSGAVLRARRSDSDFCLVELNDEVPDDFEAYFAGFDASGVTPSSTAGIHHPSGDIKKISYDDDPPGLSGFFGSGTDHWEVYDWDDGTTEGGSSGSPLFDQDRHIIGQLHGGSASCSNDLEDYYGRLAVSWDGSSSSRRLRDWLDPLDGGVKVVDGYDPTQTGTVNDASLYAILEPLDGTTTCDATITPEVRIRNRGSAALTSVEIRWSWDGGAPATQAWTGNLAQGAIETVVLPAASMSDGPHTLTASTSEPNGVADEDPSNDERSVAFTVATGPGVYVPYTLDFEASLFPPLGVTIENPDGWYTWERSGQVGGFGASSASAFVNNYDEDFSGRGDRLVLPAMDFSHLLSPASLEFAVAYSRYDRNLWDALSIQVSSDCGRTWTEVYYKENNTLSTTGHDDRDYFVPTSSEWRTETVDLDAFIGEPAVSIAFENISGYGNVLYIDDIDVFGELPDIDEDLDGWTQRDGDCNDADPSIHPGADEIPDDGIDQDCSGTDARTCYVDEDGDGYGNVGGVTVVAADGMCEAAEGESTSHDDCDDEDIAVHPNATEICTDAIDNDCDADADCDDPDCDYHAACGGCVDVDGDGFLDDACGGFDCDDAEATVHPGAPEICDGLDNDCDDVLPADEMDRDGDGWSPCEGDCDDFAWGRHPGAVESCNGIDDDCDGVVPPDEEDADADGFAACEGDCDDADDLLGPAMPEICGDGLDNDCDGSDRDCAVVVERGGCGCASGPAAPGVGWLAVVLGAVLSRRRRTGEPTR